MMGPFSLDWPLHLKRSSGIINISKTLREVCRTEVTPSLQLKCTPLVFIKRGNLGLVLPKKEGRYENINRSERICKLCNSKSVECEYHFLLVCPFYRELRQKYFKPYYWHWPTINKFEDLMTKTNRKIILNVAKFLYDASNLRKINTV